MMSPVDKFGLGTERVGEIFFRGPEAFSFGVF